MQQTIQERLKGLREITANDVGRDYYAFVLSGDDRATLFSVAPEPICRPSVNPLVQGAPRRVSFD